MLTNTWSVIFILHILVTVGYYHVVVLAYNSLMTEEVYHLLMYN